MASAPQPAERILVVDDDADLRETLAMVLEEEGFQVDGAASGVEALRYLRNHPPPSLILLDLMMPIMNGWEFRRQQRADPKIAQIPVVVVSATADSHADLAPLEVADALVKPTDLDQLIETVRQHSRVPASPPVASGLKIAPH